MFNFFKSTEKKLEEAKNKLISDLEKGSIDFVLKQMESEDIYSPLLNEIRKTCVSNTHDVCYYAYGRATKYNSVSDKEQLLEKLSIETNPIRRKNIYFCLAHLCNNTTDKQLFNFLMEKIELEENESKRSILIGIQDMHKDSDLNIEPLKKLAKPRYHELYWNAIFALRFTHDNEVESLLLTLFEETNNNGKKGVISATLKTIGTSKSIPILEATYKKTRDNSLRWDIEEAISSIQEREK
jgi:hypothetical protein